MSSNNTRVRRRACTMLGVVLLVLLGALAPASAAGTSTHRAASACPRPDRGSNVLVMQPGQNSITFPGSRTADFCNGAARYAKTELWPGEKPTSNRTVVVPDQGTWSLRGDGRLSFAVSRQARTRPAGVRGPGHDVVMKFSIVDAKGHYRSGLALAYVVYPGASGFDDQLTVCNGDQVVRPLANDVAGWRGTNRYDKRQARLRPETLRLADTSEGSQVPTEQGVWKVLRQGRVQFVPKAGWRGSTAPLRYSVRDTYGNTASATITARSCLAASPPANDAKNAKNASALTGTASSTQTSSGGLDERTWLPLGLAAVCLVVGGLVLRRRRGGES